MKRAKMNHKKSKRLFSSTAKKHHPKNSPKHAPMRGGYRL